MLYRHSSSTLLVNMLLKGLGANQENFQLNGTHQLLVYSDDGNILSGSVRTVKKKAEAFLADCKKSGLEVNAKKTEYMIIYRDQHAGQNHNLKINN